MGGFIVSASVLTTAILILLVTCPCNARFDGQASRAHRALNDIRNEQSEAFRLGQQQQQQQRRVPSTSTLRDAETTPQPAVSPSPATVPSPSPSPSPSPVPSPSPSPLLVPSPSPPSLPSKELASKTTSPSTSSPEWSSQVAVARSALDNAYKHAHVLSSALVGVAIGAGVLLLVVAALAVLSCMRGRKIRQLQHIVDSSKQAPLCHVADSATVLPIKPDVKQAATTQIGVHYV